MKGSPRLLVILTACAGLLLELLILVVMLLPTSGPGADAAVSKSAFIVQASVLAIVHLSDVPAKKGAVMVPVELRGLPDEVEVLDVEPAAITVLLGEQTP